MVVALSVLQCVLFYLFVSVVFSCLFCLAVRSVFGSVLSFPFPFAFFTLLSSLVLSIGRVLLCFHVRSCIVTLIRAYSLDIQVVVL